MENVANNILLRKPIGALILGDQEKFSMENRLFSLMCFIAMAVLAVFLVINSLMGYWAISTLVIGVFICEAVFYYFSRFRAVYRTNIIINGFLGYITLIINYYYDSGINGSTIFLFFFTFHWLVTGTPNRMHRYWLALHIVIVTIIMAVEYCLPNLIPYLYQSRGERIMDVFSCYIVTLVFVFAITRFLLNSYLNEKVKTEDRQFKLKAFFETSACSYFLLNKHFEITYFNNAAAAFVYTAYGIQLQEGLPIMQLIGDNYCQNFENHLKNALNGLNYQKEQLISHNKQTGNIWLHISFATVLNNRKKIVGVALTLDDITERKEQEAKLIQHRLSLMQIAYVQSHGLRQPVSSILGLLALVKDDEQNAEEYLHYLDKAVSELDNRLDEILVHKKVSVSL